MRFAVQIPLAPRGLALALFCSIALVACGGGGGGLVRSPAPTSPPPAPLPTPPPPSSAVPCPAPVTAPCYIEGRGDFLAFNEFGMTGGRQSEFGLLVGGGRYGGGFVNLFGGEYRFSGGTSIGGTTLVVWDTLVSDVQIARDYTGLGFAGESELWLLGTVRGNVINDGLLNLRCWSGIHDCSSVPQQRIVGNYTQLPDAKLEIVLGRNLHVTGNATLNGWLALRPGDARFVLPTAPGNALLLHADGGVFGQFEGWTSPGLFLEGSLRYGSNDVWFDLKRISVQAAMTTAGAAPLTLASAGNLDRALAGGDVFASAATATLNPAQSRFLQSAGHLLWMDDAKQAARSLDSLSGSEHADALRRAGHGDAMASALGQRLLSLQSGEVSGSWSRSGVHGTVAGFDQWIGSRLLLGASASIGNNTEAGGQARDHERQAALYLRWFGDDGWYAGGNAGFAHHALTVDRPIDLGPGGRWNAHSQRGVGVAAIDAEVGQRFSVGGGVLAPYAALGADVIRSERALEQGATGFELALQANTQARLTSGVGLRYGKRWHLSEGGWLQLDADARVQHGLADAGSPLQAAFIGVPDVGFALPGSQTNTSGWLDVGLRGGFGPGWNWSLGHTGSFAGPRPERRWLLGLQRKF